MRWLAATAGALAAAAVGLTVGRDDPPRSPARSVAPDDARAARDDAGATSSPGTGPSVRAPEDAGVSRNAAQGRPAARIRRRGNIDFVGDPPNRLRAADDGGTPAPAPVSASAASPSEPAADAGTGASPREVELRRRIEALEQQLASSREQVAELQSVNEHLAGLRQQLADAQQERHDKERQAEQRKAEVQQAVSQLYGVQQALANGNGDVADALSSAGSSLPATAQRELESARLAVASGDLYAARMHVAAAIAAAQQRGE